MLLIPSDRIMHMLAGRPWVHGSLGWRSYTSSHPPRKANARNRRPLRACSRPSICSGVCCQHKPLQRKASLDHAAAAAGVLSEHAQLHVGSGDALLCSPGLCNHDLCSHDLEVEQLATGVSSNDPR